MQISLHKLRQAKDGTLRLEESVNLDSLVKEVSGLVRLDPVEVRACVTLPEPHLIEAEAAQDTRAVLTCSRCLQEFRVDLSGSWTEHFTDDPEMAGETEDGEIHPVEGETLNLDPFVREAVLLQLPYVPVCREDCKGLCPVCGADRNRNSCECRVERIDPRLAVLQDLFKQDDPKDE
ncbi:YceD family protein [Staphylospora marina]|uniref:YceD family protein n=1 Tax=Staphylospora marina TaxID=2490858 RepID=UPI000F5BD46F|nr:DUF177 domain-containing protein [Staphylospora marina]